MRLGAARLLSDRLRSNRLCVATSAVARPSQTNKQSWWMWAGHLGRLGAKDAPCVCHVATSWRRPGGGKPSAGTPVDAERSRLNRGHRRLGGKRRWDDLIQRRVEEALEREEPWQQATQVRASWMATDTLLFRRALRRRNSMHLDKMNGVPLFHPSTRRRNVGTRTGYRHRISVLATYLASEIADHADKRGARIVPGKATNADSAPSLGPFDFRTKTQNNNSVVRR